MSKEPNIKDLIEAYQSMELARHHLEKLEVRVEEAQKMCVNLKTVLEKEYEDIQELEKLSVPVLFSRILKSKDAQMEIEKQEYLHAVLRFNEARRMLELLEYEKKVLTEKLQNQSKIKKQLDAALQSRSQHVARQFPGLISEINSYHLRIDQNTALKRELNEAILIGLKASQLLSEMIEQLKKVVNWGQWPTSGPQNNQSESKTHQLDKAQLLSYQIKQLLQQLEDELEDIYRFQRIKGAYSFEDFEHFTDIYANRLISDWIIRKKIQSSLANVRAVQDSITLVVKSLKQELKQTDISIQYLEGQKEQVILGWKV